MTPFKTLAWPAVLTLLLVGCANPYRANFNSTKNRYPEWLEPRLSQKTSTPRIQRTDNIQNENWQLVQAGYLMMGFAKFDGPTMDDSLALDVARSVGADIVAVEKKYSRTLTETVTVIGWPQDQRIDTREDVIASGPGGTRQVTRRSETTISGTPQESYVPRDVDYFEYSATFWRKLQRPVFGAFVHDITDDVKQKLQTNRGLVVRAIIADSPAYKADLLQGDIITQIDGEPVPSAKKFYEEIVLKAGKTSNLTILRGNQTITRKITLGS